MRDAENGSARWTEALRRAGPVEQVFDLSAGELGQLYGRHLNPVAIRLMKFLGMNRTFARAQGIYLYDEAGRRYLDFLSGFGALNLGHEPEEVLRALRLAEARVNLCQSLPNPAAAKLAELLSGIAPGSLPRVFFCNSGTEAVEAALKLARCATGRRVLLSASGAYHGKTFGSLSVSGREKYKTPFLPLLPDTEQIPYDDLEALERRLAREDVAGFIAEPIQGENGVLVPRDGYLKQAEEICRRYDTLFLADEVQTGFGRTGRLFGCDHDGASPDILIVSKALSGGVVPVGAILTTDAVWKKAYGSMETAFLHSSTFGGNTRACLAGFAAVRTLLEKNLIERPRELGPHLLAGLRTLQSRYELLKEVRGRGFMVGISLARFRGKDKFSEGLLTLWTARQLFKRHRIITIFTLNHLDTLRIAPPLVTDPGALDNFLNALEDVLKRGKTFRLLRLIREG